MSNFFIQELKNDGKDITSKALFNKKEIAKAKIIAKEAGLLAGQEEMRFFLAKKFPKITQNWHKKDRQNFQKNDNIVEFEGKALDLLKLERVLLNFLSRLSGIATITKKYADKFPLSATRKTLWGILDKKAVVIGGGFTHRLNLEDAILIKENHILLAGSIKNALQKIEESRKMGAFWEIEIENESELQEVLDNLPQKRPGVIMFDNFPPAEIKAILQKITKPQGIIFEASGGITENTIENYISTGVDVLSAGFLTKHAHSIDLSMYFSKK